MDVESYFNIYTKKETKQNKAKKKQKKQPKYVLCMCSFYVLTPTRSSNRNTNSDPSTHLIITPQILILTHTLVFSGCHFRSIEHI